MTTVDLTPRLHAAVDAAIRAPSLHNTQPWRFRCRDGSLEVRLDRSRRLAVADPRGWAARLACGAAALNARLALAVLGLATTVRLRPDPTDSDLMIQLTCGGDQAPTPIEQRLFDAIARRRSNRAPFWPQPVPADARAALVAAARVENAWLELVIGTPAVEAITEIARAAGRVLDRDPAYRAEMRAWARDDDSARDGVPWWAGGVSQEPHDVLPVRDSGGPTRAPGQAFEGEPLVAVLGAAGDGANDQLTAGMALQRVLLTATAAGLAASMLSQPIEVAAAREQLRIALGRYGTPQMVVRIGYGRPAFRTPRRPPTDVIDA